MKKIFSKLKSFLMESNHYKHLIGGFLVGIIGLNAGRHCSPPSWQHRAWSIRTLLMATNGTGRTGRVRSSEAASPCSFGQ